VTPLLSTAILRAQSDARLAALAREGHDRAFEAIVERHRRPLLAHARRILPHGRAEDVVQQTFLSAWAALRAGQDVRDLRAWLHRIVHNTALNAHKRAGYDYDQLRDSLLGAAAPEEDLERRRIMRETLAGMAALPERQREALLRIAVQGASQSEVARELGITDGALRQLVHRARASVRAAATAITPFPIAARLAAMAADGPPAVANVGELTAGAASAGVGGALVKAGTAVVVAGAVATGPSTEIPRHHRSATLSPPALGVEAANAAPAPAAAAPRPVAVRVRVRGDAGGPGHGDSGRRGDAGSGRRPGRGGSGDGEDRSGPGHSGTGPGRSGSGRSGPDGFEDGHSGPGSGDRDDRQRADEHSSSGEGPGSDSDSGSGSGSGESEPADLGSSGPGPSGSEDSAPPPDPIGIEDGRPHGGDGGDSGSGSSDD
jgi:RNA polymerase sigma factor (sigma-70 family)